MRVVINSAAGTDHRDRLATKIVLTNLVDVAVGS
jgi:hypothetical protein